MSRAPDTMALPAAAADAVAALRTGFRDGKRSLIGHFMHCLLYTSDAADE